MATPIASIIGSVVKKFKKSTEKPKRKSPTPRRPRAVGKAVRVAVKRKKAGGSIKPPASAPPSEFGRRRARAGGRGRGRGRGRPTTPPGQTPTPTPTRTGVTKPKRPTTRREKY